MGSQESNIMQVITFLAFMSLIASVFGAPQNTKYFGRKTVYDALSSFGGAPDEYAEVQKSFGSRNRLPNDQKAQYFIIMKALLKVMESSNPSPNDINTLMVLTRDLVKRIPEGSIKLPFNFGSNDIGNMGLPETGDIIVNIRGVPHIVTEMGSFPLSAVSLLSEEEKDQYIPTIRTFKRVLDDSLANDGPDPKDINLLVYKCKEFSKLFPQSPCTKMNLNPN